jgi:hypothetical protein
MSATVVWFRRDLRLDEQPALAAAIARGQPILPLFIWAPEEESPWEPGSASALVAPMLRTPAHVTAAGVSILASLAFSFIPYNGGLLIAAALAMMAGAEVERRSTPK